MVTLISSAGTHVIFIKGSARGRWRLDGLTVDSGGFAFDSQGTHTIENLVVQTKTTDAMVPRCSVNDELFPGLP